MVLAAGARVGVYEITSAIGAGGMGEVYRAKDSRLKREVALKVLRSSVAQDADRLARFQREAEVLASLNHPHIAQIYGVEEAGGTTALVMELVDGEDLAQRIAGGPLALDEAVAVAKQLTAALAAAHEAGIVHRDLKPANIKVRPDGTVKVLDFGLAKALDANPAGSTTDHSPTITTPAMTAAGMILGTAAYMSPEQARGKIVDKRTDIWAFGCVFYEMLTGERLFSGDALTDVLASVIKDQLDVGKAPSSMQRLLKRCLEKDPRDRLRDIGDAWALVADDHRAVAPAQSTSRLPWAIAAVLALVATVLSVLLVTRRAAPTAAAPVVQFQLPVPEEAGAMSGTVMSPDGRRIAYSSGNQVWVRDLGALTPRLVPDADPIVVQPFWSGDSRFLLFSSSGALKKADDSGGPAQTICPLSATLLGGFAVGDRVVFASAPGGVFTVPSGGGKPTAVPGLMQEGTYSVQSGALLPDHDHFVVTLAHQAEEKRGIYVASLTGREAPKRLLPDMSAVTYVPSAVGSSGFLLFTRGRALMAQSFNPRSFELSGEPRRVVDGVRGFSASTNGSIVYRAEGPGRRLTWMDRQGTVLGTVGAPDQHLEVALSRDGSHAAAVRYEVSSPPATWVFDIARESSRRLTSGPAAVKPVWSADGKEVFVATGDRTSSRVVRLLSDGSGPAQTLLEGDNVTFSWPRDVSADGKWLLVVQVRPRTTKEDLWLLSLLPGEHKPEPYLVTDYIETDGMFSPDGRFVAYVSNESGRFELYVRSLPVSAGGKWRISTGGGYQPRWRRDGKELFFFTADGLLMSTDVTLVPTFRASTPRALFLAPIFGGGATTTNQYWDLTPDGQRFLINTTTANDPSSVLTVVLNWQSGSAPGGRD